MPLIVGGGWLVGAIYGGDYESSGALIGWFAAAQAIRMARFAPTMAAMAYSDTANGMFANLIRFSALLLSLAVILHGGSLKWIAAGNFGGEPCARQFDCGA